jgi:hypothetical protein
MSYCWHLGNPFLLKLPSRSLQWHLQNAAHSLLCPGSQRGLCRRKRKENYLTVTKKEREEKRV